MSRRVAPSNANQVSLFPFLAVLVCTMGALLVLLVVMAHQARVRAADLPSPDNPPPAPLPISRISAEELDKAEKELEQRRAHIQQLLAKSKESLQQRNLELAHLEEDLRRWHDRLVELRNEYERLKNVGNSTAEQQQIMQDELLRLKEDIAISEKLLAEEKQKQLNQSKSFSLIPYDGASGTYRRPLYVECTAEKVTLQPLGIVLDQTDFDGPLGPENPLAASLRAMRQYLAKNSATAGQPQAEPYPFLIVRPNGIGEYSAARIAIKSWGADFGYEFVEQDLNLDWGQPDPRMAEVVQAALAQARTHQRMLMKAAPKRFRTNRSAGTRTGGGNGQRAGGDHAGQGPSGGGGNSQQGTAGSAGPLNSGDGSGTARGDGSRVSAGQYDPKTGPGNVQQGSARPDQVRAGAQGGMQGGAAGGDALEGGTLRSVAASRGSNWALPQKRRGAIGYSRPISVQIQADRLIFPNHQGAGREIVLGPRTRDSVDKVVAVVWKQMEDWGSAGNGTYWKPVLKCEIAPNAQSRFKALTILLIDSGIDIGIKQR